MRTAAGLFCVLGICLTMASAAPPQGIAWSSSEKEGTAKSAESGIPTLVYFTADYCSYCKKLDRDVWSHAAVVSQVSSKFVPVKINASHDALTPRSRKITGYPTIIILNPEGKEVDRIVGYSNAAGIQAKLTAALNKLPQRTAEPVVMQ